VSLTYSQSCINYRLLGVVTAIDSGGGNGSLILTSSGTTISTIALSVPSGTVAGGILTFQGTLLDPAASATGFVNGAVVKDFSGAVQVSGLTVGIPGATGVDIILSNGLNSTLISAGQTVAVISAQITGS
jgi:hypothetical protein